MTLEAPVRSHQGGGAVGLVEVSGFATAIAIADSMAKSATVAVRPLAFIGDGLVSVFAIGSVADVAVAVEAGVEVARRAGIVAGRTVLGRPFDDVRVAFDLAPEHAPAREEG